MIALLGAMFVQPATAFNRVVLLEDAFSNLNNWKDMTLAVDWGNQSSPDSAFAIVDGSVQISSAAQGWTSYTTSTGLRTFTSLDFQFPEKIQHSSSVLEIEFRARWQRYGTGKAENNRFLVTVQHDYPEEGIVLNNPLLITDPTGHPWARPAYQIRMRGAGDNVLDANNGGSTILQYGGGAVAEGEYEYLASYGWWVPGFNASAVYRRANPGSSSGGVCALPSRQ